MKELPETLLEDEQHWRERAEEASTIAESMTHPEPKRMWEGIAREYNWMADQAARREARG